jgi:adenylate cyclase
MRVSRGTRHVRKHRLAAFEDLGEQKVKNISQPVRAFKVRIGEAAPEEPVPSLAEGAEDGEGPALPTSSIEGAELELAFWNSIKDSERVTEFELYLKRYPDGPFADLAKSRLGAIRSAQGTSLSDVARQEVLAVELAFWEAAKESNSAAELRAYLDRYPSGEFTALANARLDALEDSAGGKPVEEPEPVAVELSFWETVKDSRNPVMLKAYVEKYPSGSFIELAKIMLAELEHAKEN